MDFAGWQMGVRCFRVSLVQPRAYNLSMNTPSGMQLFASNLLMLALSIQLEIDNGIFDSFHVWASIVEPAFFIREHESKSYIAKRQYSSVTVSLSLSYTKNLCFVTKITKRDKRLIVRDDLLSLSYTKILCSVTSYIFSLISL